MRQLLVLIMGYFIAGSAYSFIPISTVPIYTLHTESNKTATTYQDGVNEKLKVELEQKKLRQRDKKPIGEHEKPDSVDRKAIENFTTTHP